MEFCSVNDEQKSLELFKISEDLYQSHVVVVVIDF